MEDLLNTMLNLTRSFEIMAIIAIVVYVPFGIYIIFNALMKELADKLYAKLDERKQQKEYDEMITRHEERYHTNK